MEKEIQKENINFLLFKSSKNIECDYKYTEESMNTKTRVFLTESYPKTSPIKTKHHKRYYLIFIKLKILFII